MPQTANSLLSVMHEAWTQKTIKKQYYGDDGPLKRIETVEATMMGTQAQVPIGSDLNSGGFTTTSAAGGFVNAAGNQPVNKALYTMSQHFFPISLEISVLNQAASAVQSAIAGKDIEVQGAIDTMRNQATRQLVTNGDGVLAQCASGGASTTVSLLPSPSGTAYGYDAIVRNWLRPGATVDIGTMGDTDTLAAGAQVLGVTESASGPAITINSSITTVAGTHFVFVANPNSATAANPEMNGLRNIVGTGSLGGLNPATQGQEFWQPAMRDTSTAVYSLDLSLNMQRAVQQKSGQPETDVWSGLKQQVNHYSLLQNQVRFAGDMSLGAGEVGKVKWNGLVWTAFNAILDSDLYFLTLRDFVRVTGAFTEPEWVSKLQGANPGAIWNVGQTNFADMLFYILQVGVSRRNTHAGAFALTA